jgi:hypothetical protein
MAKKKGDKGGNPAPVQTEEFKARQIPKADVDLATKPICLKLPVEADAVLRGMPNRSEYIRAAVLQRLEADGLLPEVPECQD